MRRLIRAIPLKPLAGALQNVFLSPLELYEMFFPSLTFEEDGGPGGHIQIRGGAEGEGPQP